MIHEKKRHNLNHPIGLQEFNERCEFLKSEKAIVELAVYKHSRSSLQNSSMHLYFTQIATALNQAGYQYSKISIIDGDIIDVPFTLEIIKEELWRKIQIVEFGIESTTKIDSIQINKIIDIITLWLSNKGIQVDFPNRNSLFNNKSI